MGGFKSKFRDDAEFVYNIGKTLYTAFDNLGTIVKTVLTELRDAVENALFFNGPKYAGYAHGKIVFDAILTTVTGGTSLAQTIAVKGLSLFRSLGDDLVAVVKKGVQGAKSILSPFAGKVWREIARKGNRGVPAVLAPVYKSIDDLILNDPKYASDLLAAWNNYKVKYPNSTFDYYKVKYETITRNRLRGKYSELEFQKLLGGIKPNTPIQAGGFTRYIDNLLDGVAREIKSGKITLESTNFKRQIMADMIIARSQIGGVKMIEWHALDGITDEAMQFIYDEMKKNNLIGQNRFNVIIYN